jgi:hypothetical protein
MSSAQKRISPTDSAKKAASKATKSASITCYLQIAMAAIWTDRRQNGVKIVGRARKEPVKEWLGFGFSPKPTARERQVPTHAGQ